MSGLTLPPSRNINISRRFTSYQFQYFLPQQSSIVPRIVHSKEYSCPFQHTLDLDSRHWDIFNFHRINLWMRKVSLSKLVASCVMLLVRNIWFVRYYLHKTWNTPVAIFHLQNIISLKSKVLDYLTNDKLSQSKSKCKV